MLPNFNSFDQGQHGHPLHHQDRKQHLPIWIGDGGDEYNVDAEHSNDDPEQECVVYDLGNGDDDNAQVVLG
ncbi:hypothetical protein KSS87_009010 [Heliosperma pusillum]|nr:hypothetical protein KSS87_009010 [Heliosperma pusillum]